MCLLKRKAVLTDRSFLKNWLSFFMISLMILNGLDGRTTRVMTKFGRIQGLWSRSTRGRYVAYYLGVPYAEPPVGNLRFRSPQPWTRMWNGTYDATRNPPMCVQLNSSGNLIGNEDCLYLNIYVPEISKNQEIGKLPVMMFVHGERFTNGNSDSRQLPPNYLMDQDVILVTINYRLNILGFFSTASKASPGNYGLKDILMALRWLQENIGAFNGDTNAVTLWGHSSGAAAVHALALTRKTEGLFNRYILQSGNALCPWALNTRSWTRNVAWKTARLLDCLSSYEEEDTRADKDTSTVQLDVATGSENDEDELDEDAEEDMMLCLRNVDIEKIANVIDYRVSRDAFTEDSKFREFIKQKAWRQHPCCIFSPTIEEESNDAIMTMHPLNAIKNGLFRDIPFIIGLVKDEGLVKTIDVITNETVEMELINNFENYLPYMLDYYQLITNKSAFIDAIEEFYFAGNVSLHLQENITDVISDGLMFWPAYETLNFQSTFMNSNTYFYLFSYEGTFSNTFSSGIPVQYGVAHGDDLNYLIPILNKRYKNNTLHNTEADVTVINIMTEMWASFATDGVPRAWRTVEWPDYKKSYKFLLFGMEKEPEIIVENEFFPERMSFWDELTTNFTFDPIEPDINTDSSLEDKLERFGLNIASKGSFNEALSYFLMLITMFLLQI